VWAAIIIVVGLAVGWRDYKALREAGRTRYRLALAALYAAAFALCVAEAAQAPIPNPLRLTIWVFEPLNDFIYSMSD